VIALADFGAPQGPYLGGTVAVNHLIQGLAPSERLPGMARTQLYFIDAGRRPIKLNFDVANAPPVFDLPSRPQLDDRQLAVFQASSPGEKAYGNFFNMALMRCLGGEAGVLVRDGGQPQYQPTWLVTINSLVHALPAVFQSLVTAGGTPEQRVFVTSMSGDAAFVRLDGPPSVPVTVQFDPPEASEWAVFDIRHADYTPVDVPEGARTPGRRKLILTGGEYLVRVSFRAPTGKETEPAQKDVQFISMVMPPRADWSIEVSREPSFRASRG
jgi:hypothetical protein